MSSLHLAIAEGNDSQIEWLLEHGEEGQILLADREGDTPLMLAVRRHIYDWHLQKLLERGADLQARNNQGMTALMQALDYNNLPAVETLLAWYKQKGVPAHIEPSIEQGRLALFFAAYNDDVSAAEALLQAGTEVDGRNKWARTPLMLTAEAGQEEVMRLLLERGATVDCVDEAGDTALALATGAGHAGCVHLLLEYGADVHLRDQQDRTALMYAALGGDVEIIDLLLTHGAQANVRDTAGITALQLAQGWVGKGIVERLRKAEGEA